MGDTGSIISTTNLIRRFGSKTALNDVTLRVGRGSVFGLVGENGAGKTTLIKHILGLLRAESGTVRVFDMDPVASRCSWTHRIPVRTTGLAGVDAGR
jgi:ABC-2 type transport system ATP-binding protein